MFDRTIKMEMILPARFFIFYDNNLHLEEYLFSLYSFSLVTIVKNHCNKTHVNQRVNDVTA